MMKAEPQKEHQWLQRLVGDWTMESDCSMGPDKPREKFNGTERFRSLGGIWFIGEGEGEMPGGGTGKMVMTLGYDPQQKKYVGTWIGSMMTQLWVYDASMDAAGKVLTLAGTGPSFAGDGTMAKYRDVIEFQSDDQRTLRSYVQGDDGKWAEFMTATYRRKH
ncbi:MAG: DUF1579 domain-containing protein [Tepidisphaeraceae bacterium]